MTATIPPVVTESEFTAWLVEALGEHVQGDYDAARLLLATFDLAAKEGRSLNNPHEVANCIASTPNPDGPWSSIETRNAAKLLHEMYRVTRKPVGWALRLVELPMPVVVSRHQCPFCRRFTRADVRAVQDHMGRCWQNPGLRCCKTCDWHQDGSHPEDDESCRHPDGPEWEDYRFPVLHCPLWGRESAAKAPSGAPSSPLAASGPVEAPRSSRTLLAAPRAA
jgi:hypothetical protein